MGLCWRGNEEVFFFSETVLYIRVPCFLYLAEDKPYPKPINPKPIKPKPSTQKPLIRPSVSHMQ